jgi:uncharacterized protein with HEPN domain
MSRDWLLFLDDLIASGQKIGRLTGGLSAEQLVANEAAFDAVLFNLQIIGEAVKAFPPEALEGLSPQHRSAPGRLRDLIAHHYFSLDPDIVWDVAVHHVPSLLAEALALQSGADGDRIGTVDPA